MLLKSKKWCAIKVRPLGDVCDRFDLYNTSVESAWYVRNKWWEIDVDPLTGIAYTYHIPEGAVLHGSVGTIYL